MSKILLTLLLGLGGAATVTNIVLHLPILKWTPTVSAPEIDPATAISALLLLVGVIAVIRGRVAAK